ncbi:LCP family protein, partial [Amycolatopsis sp. SID8362]|uniref:LCP family protein n=1 Tax=Amycolatopsis sp. SID8362 TaxID=2690346 RepID=UPI00136DA702
MHPLGKIVVSGLALVVFCGTAYGYVNFQALDEVTRDSVIDGDGGTNPGEQPADGSLDVLLVGRDARTDPQGNPLSPDVLRELRVGANGDDLTDTLIVLRIPNGTKEVKAFSIPRDSYVSMPGGKGKINAAFGRAKAAEARRLRTAGETDKAKIDQSALTAARRATRQAVEDLTGVKIDHFAEVNLLSFSEISKAVGGVDVCLKAPTQDRNSGANFPAGPQRISGADALAFVRQRDNLRGGDFDRVRRQQVFLAGLARQVLSAGTLGDPGKLSDLIDAVKRSVVLDSSWNLLDFVAQMRGVSGGGIQFDTIPIVNPDYRYDPADRRATAVQVDPAAV